MEYKSYDEVPVYRRSSINSWLVFLGLFFPPFIWFVAYIVATGNVFFNKNKEDGSLKKWSKANKVVAWIIILGQLYFLIRWFL